MLIVRDRTQEGYKGRPTYAVHSDCPCRRCFNAHDCGYVDSQGKQHIDMQCATNYNQGCPSNSEPNHIWRGKTCIRCGTHKL